jgi:hypothetical protein
VVGRWRENEEEGEWKEGEEKRKLMILMINVIDNYVLAY